MGFFQTRNYYFRVFFFQNVHLIKIANNQYTHYSSHGQVHVNGRCLQIYEIQDINH